MGRMVSVHATFFKNQKKTAFFLYPQRREWTRWEHDAVHSCKVEFTTELQFVCKRKWNFGVLCAVQMEKNISKPPKTNFFFGVGDSFSFCTTAHLYSHWVYNLHYQRGRARGGGSSKRFLFPPKKTPQKSSLCPRGFGTMLASLVLLLIIPCTSHRLPLLCSCIDKITSTAYFATYFAAISAVCFLNVFIKSWPFAVDALQDSSWDRLETFALFCYLHWQWFLCCSKSLICPGFYHWSLAAHARNSFVDIYFLLYAHPSFFFHAKAAEDAHSKQDANNRKSSMV